MYEGIAEPASDRRELISDPMTLMRSRRSLYVLVGSGEGVMMGFSGAA